MKKKILVTLLSLVLTAGMVCGCGNKTDPGMATDANITTVESTEPTEENNPIVESEYSAETEESKESEEESAVAPTPVPQAPDAALDAQDNSEGAETAKESESEGAVSTTVAAETTAPVAETPDVMPPSEQAAAYTVTEMAVTMYAKNAVNLRQGPGTEYAKVGNLTKGQQVTVTGQADNGWYQLDSGAFVSNNYLTDMAPTRQVSDTTPKDSTDQTDTIIPVGTSTESFGGISVDFINYLNQQRSSTGLGTLTWDDNLAALAQQRAQQIVTNYSHNGSPDGCGEIILYTYDSSYTSWYDIWYNSTSHRESMFLSSYGKAACGYFFNGYYYYVVTLFQQRELTQEELQQIMNPDNMVQISDNVYVPKDQVEYITPMDPNNPEDAEIIKKMEEERKKLDDGTMERVFD